MTSKSMNTTTSIIAVLSLLQPLPGFAQSSGVVVDTRSFEQICADAAISDAFACQLQVEEMLAMAIAASLEADAAAAQANADADAAAQAAAGADEASKPAADAIAAELAQAALDAQAVAAMAAEAVQRLAVEAEAAALVSANAEAEAQAAADAEAQAAADAEAQAAADAEAQAAADAEAQAAADAETQAAADAEAQAAADAEAQAAADAEAQAAADAAAQAEADAAAETEPAPEPEPAPQDTAETEPLPEEAVDPALLIDPLLADCLLVVTDPDGTLRCGDPFALEGVAALATEPGAEPDPDAQVTVEEITESTARSSDEEFTEWTPETAQSTAAASDSGTAVSEGRSGLSNLERAGLVVLGAVVVGAILSNGQRVESNTGDRVIVRDNDDTYRVLKDDDALLRQPGSRVQTETFNDGSTITTVTREDGSQIVTIRDSTGRALRRSLIDVDGSEFLLIDDTQTVEPVVVSTLPKPVYDNFEYQAASDRESMLLAMLAADRQDLGRNFSLRQVRDIVQVRELAPEISIGAVTFASNSSALQPEQAAQLRELGYLMRDIIAQNPTEVFLIEGHTDAVGSAAHNLLLSDRRAETVALALSEYFQVPPENMVVQGYGEDFLKVLTQESEQLNRRVAVRRITPLLRPY